MSLNSICHHIARSILNTVNMNVTVLCVPIYACNEYTVYSILYGLSFYINIYQTRSRVCVFIGPLQGYIDIDVNRFRSG